MDRTFAQKLAGVLRVLVIILLVCNFAALLLVPGVTALVADGGPEMVRRALLSTLDWPKYGEQGFVSLPLFMALAYIGVWAERALAERVIFLWLCGICTAVFLWQAKRVLDTIRCSEPFSEENVANMRRAAICCFVITGVSAARIVWSVCHHSYFGSLAAYTLLLGLAFLLAGLLCLIMSALFRRAAEMKAEQDLTI